MSATMSRTVALIITMVTLAEASELPPSIVMFIADDLGFNDLSITNPERHTPTIERMANEGVRLNRYYTYKYVRKTIAARTTKR